MADSRSDTELLSTGVDLLMPVGLVFSMLLKFIVSGLGEEEEKKLPDGTRVLAHCRRMEERPSPRGRGHRGGGLEEPFVHVDCFEHIERWRAKEYRISSGKRTTRHL